MKKKKIQKFELCTLRNRFLSWFTPHTSLMKFSPLLLKVYHLYFCSNARENINTTSSHLRWASYLQHNCKVLTHQCSLLHQLYGEKSRIIWMNVISAQWNTIACPNVTSGSKPVPYEGGVLPPRLTKKRQLLVVWKMCIMFRLLIRTMTTCQLFVVHVNHPNWAEWSDSRCWFVERKGGASVFWIKTIELSASRPKCCCLPKTT